MSSQITLQNEVTETIKDEAFDVASNWKLVWWRFKKHRLALVSAVVLSGIILIALFPDFFSTKKSK
jgi:peptide/nickel transport system permease protein